MAKKHDEVTSVQGIVKDLLVSVLLLVGAFFLEWIKKSLFPEGVPQVILFILNVGEFTLAAAFLNSFIRMIVSLIINVKHLSSVMRIGDFWQAIKSMQLGRATRQGVINALGWGLLSAFVIAIFLIAALLLGRVPRVLFVSLGALFVLYALIRVAVDSGPFGMFASAISFVSIFVGVIGCVLLLIPFFSYLADLTGTSDAINTVLNFLFFRE